MSGIDCWHDLADAICHHDVTREQHAWAEFLAEVRCGCGKLATHLTAPEDSAEWSCRVLTISHPDAAPAARSGDGPTALGSAPGPAGEPLK